MIERKDGPPFPPLQLHMQNVKMQGFFESGFPRALETMENLENHQKIMHGKLMEFEKKTE